MILPILAGVCFGAGIFGWTYGIVHQNWTAAVCSSVSMVFGIGVLVYMG